MGRGRGGRAGGLLLLLSAAARAVVRDGEIVPPELLVRLVHLLLEGRELHHVVVLLGRLLERPLQQRVGLLHRLGVGRGRRGRGLAMMVMMMVMIFLFSGSRGLVPAATGLVVVLD